MTDNIMTILDSLKDKVKVNVTDHGTYVSKGTATPLEWRRTINALKASGFVHLGGGNEWWLRPPRQTTVFPCDCPEDEVDLVPEHNICIACGKPATTPAKIEKLKLAIRRVMLEMVSRKFNDELDVKWCYEHLEHALKEAEDG